MDEANPHFAEHIRLTFGAARVQAQAERLHYCERCGYQTLHVIMTHGLQETFYCLACGQPSTYTVR